MHESGIPHLREALLFLALAGILIPLLQRFRISNVLGFLVVGLVVGPFGLGRFAADLPWLSWLSFSGGPGVAALAEMGVMFLMFSIGLELSTERLWAMRRWVFGAGTLQIVVTAGAVGLIAARFGHAADTALLIGLILAFSSTAVVMQLLSARHELGTPTGRSVFSILLMQDLAVVPVLILVGTLGSPGGGGVTLSVAIALLKAAAAIAFERVAHRHGIDGDGAPGSTDPLARERGDALHQWYATWQVAALRKEAAQRFRRAHGDQIGDIRVRVLLDDVKTDRRARRGVPDQLRCEGQDRQDAEQRHGACRGDGVAEPGHAPISRRRRKAGWCAGV